VVRILAGMAWHRAISMIEVKGISKVYLVGKKGQFLIALQDVSFAIEAGAFICILGPSGCGKTTLLHIIAGFDAPTVGEVRHNGAVVAHPSPARTVVLQQYGLFPWMSVAKNIEFGLKAKGLNAAERRERVAYYVDLVRLRGFQNAYPHQISGGMKQRVALARALAPDPDVVLMDEPYLHRSVFSHLHERLCRFQGRRPIPRPGGAMPGCGTRAIRQGGAVALRPAPHIDRHAHRHGHRMDSRHCRRVDCGAIRVGVHDPDGADDVGNREGHRGDDHDRSHRLQHELRRHAARKAPCALARGCESTQAGW
jgi:ABC-type nitrate/sulfonate/bicarbonate transport system ATPase subunit